MMVLLLSADFWPITINCSFVTVAEHYPMYSSIFCRATVRWFVQWRGQKTTLCVISSLVALIDLFLVGISVYRWKTKTTGETFVIWLRKKTVYDDPLKSIVVPTYSDLKREHEIKLQCIEHFGTQTQYWVFFTWFSNLDNTDLTVSGETYLIPQHTYFSLVKWLYVYISNMLRNVIQAIYRVWTCSGWYKQMPY